jgi:hypothetical protein
MTDSKNQAPGRHLPALLTALVAAAVLSACGGGGGNPGAVGGSALGGSGGSSSGSTGGSGGTGSGGGTTAAASPTVSLAFVSPSGATTNSLTSAAPLTVKATVLDANKRPVPNAIVTFATDNTLAVFSPSAGTALTDVNGMASVTMRVASLSAGGAGTVTATSNVAGTAVSGGLNFAVGATTLAFGDLSATPASIQAYGSTTLSVDLMAGSSKYTDQSVDVNFSSACVAAGKATLAATAPTVKGTVQTVYRDKGCGQSDIITVSAASVSKSATTTLTIAPPAAASVQFVSALPAAQSIVIKGQGGNGRTETATLTFKVVDIFGNPLAGKEVDFTRVPVTADVVINKDKDITDADGNVVTTVNSGNTPTSFRIQATLPDTGTNGGANISTLSDSIVITTGQPVQRAFSLSSSSFNVNASIDSSPSTPAATIQLLLADAYGNPVPDGTPVVFQTNLGAVGTSSMGGCNTVNGGCAVGFRTQNPRVAQPNTPATPCNTGTGTGVTPDSTRPGLATICASTTDGTNTLFGKIAIFMSYNQARPTLNGVALSTSPSTPNDLGNLGSLGASPSKTVQVQLNDPNGNPMPAGTTIAISDPKNVTVSSVLPATVPLVKPHSSSSVDDPSGNTVSGAQGSMHTFTVSGSTSTTCNAATNTAQASFNMVVTAPDTTQTVFPFTLSFTCP